jgi:hypothetical protein
MNKIYTVTINNLTEADMRDIFYEAIEKLGVQAATNSQPAITTSVLIVER